MRSTSGNWMTIGILSGLPVVYGRLKVKSEVYQWYLDY